MRQDCVQSYPFVRYRPVNNDGERVVPSDLVAYRKSHQFRGPYCLCATVEDSDFNNHQEAAMVMLTRGPNAGEHVACCALSRCGYLGKLSSASAKSNRLMNRFIQFSWRECTLHSGCPSRFIQDEVGCI